MRKKLLSFIMCIVLCLGYSLPSFAAESDPVFTGPYAEIKASIYQQLKAQGKLEHFELQVAALIPDDNEIVSTYREAESWVAPNGGVLTYTYDWTYRGEDGYVANCVTHMTPSQTNEYLGGSFGNIGALIKELTGLGVSQLSRIPMFEFLAGITPVFATFSIIDGINDTLVRASIDNADGYGKVSVVYDSISDGYSKVICGWDTHAIVTLDYPGAYYVDFR